MTKLSLRIGIVLSLFMLVMGCKKETSLEKGGFGGTAAGELVDSLGLCKNAEVKGSYQVDTALNSTTNYVSIKVNFTSQGKYKIYSDTVNGMWFIDSGFTVSIGAAVIKLKGYGTPILPKTSDFALIFGNNLCNFSITATGTGGTGGGSGGGGTNTGTGTNGDYFPTTSGSKFVYQYIPKVGGIDTFSVNVAVGLVAVDTLSYARFATSLLDTFYFAKDGKGTYYALSTVDFDYTFIFDSVPNAFISYPFLKENASQGESWSTQDYGKVKYSNGTTSQVGVSKATFTIDAKNANWNVTTGGTTKLYTNVIVVLRDIYFKPDGSTTYSKVFSGKSYYAKGYGLIDQVFTTTPSQTLTIYGIPVIK